MPVCSSDFFYSKINKNMFSLFHSLIQDIRSLHLIVRSLGLSVSFKMEQSYSLFFFFLLVFYHIFEKYRWVILCNDTQFGFISWFCIFRSGYALGRNDIVSSQWTDVSLTSTGDAKFGRMVKVMSSGFLHCKVTNFSLCNFLINKYIVKKLFWHYILCLLELSPILNCFITYW